MKKLALFTLTTLLLAGCNEYKPVQNQAPNAEAENIPHSSAQIVEPKTGQVDLDQLGVQIDQLKSAAELDSLLNSGSGAGVSSDYFDIGLEFSFEYGSYYDTDYYDYDDYYYDYGYDYDYFEYEEIYIEEYDVVTYYEETYYEEEIFVSYPNYHRRSAPIVWSSYTWPSGYGFLTCYAQSASGAIFYGYGFPASFADDAAMATCQSSPLGGFCVPIGCQ